MSYRFPPPTSWQAFEDLCLDLFKELWDAQTTLKHGKGGESQDGVDVYGLLPNGQWFGVQCKAKEAGKQLTQETMRAEAKKAEGFNPKLARYALATTAPRTKKVQGWARGLTESTDFEEVTVYAWDDLCEAITGRHELIRTHFGNVLDVGPTDIATQDADEAVAAFRRRHWSELLPLPSLAQARGQRAADLLLTDIYTALDVEATVRVVKSGAEDSSPEGHGGPSISLPGDAAYLDALVSYEQAQLDAIEDEYPKRRQRRCRALEAAAANRHLVLVGAAGSGKSTFGRFLAACLLGTSLDRPEANLVTLVGKTDGDFQPWPHRTPLSFFISLQKFQTSDHFPGESEQGAARHLTTYLQGLGPEASRTAFARGLEVALTMQDGALVILDGLDETPSAETGRVQLKQVICGFVRAYPGCRVLVTSRPYAYKQSDRWRLDDVDFSSVDLAPFDGDQQRAFVQAWYQRLVARNLLDVDSERQKAMVADLVGQIQGTTYLAPLANSPLMLTMMADLHATNSGRLPAGGRAALYAESVELLLDRWNESRAGQKTTEVLGMSLEHIQEALQKLAFSVHRSRGVSDAETPEIQRSELWEALASTREAYDLRATVDDKRIMDYLHQRSGILIGESAFVYRFPHRSYQEYLATRYLVEEEFPGLLDEVVTEDPALWREVVQLAVGQTARQKYMAWTVIDTLVPKSVPRKKLKADDPRFFRALLAGLSIRETKLWQNVSDANGEKLERVRLWLRRIVELGALEVKDRAQAGQVLGLLGDDRPGVVLGDDGLPCFEWVEIPVGSFTMGGGRSYEGGKEFEASVDAFRISRFPVTNAQYQAFVDDGGYTERWRSCWTESGWDWLQREDREGPWEERFPFDLPNHPCVNVCWYETVAFCSWLAERTGVAIRLPTEAEWERAARGTDGREYPWGVEFDASKCNSGETEIGSTTAVGLFPDGESPAGVDGEGMLDGSGNVWEWCSTQARNNYEEEAVEDLAGSASRVVRGGAFVNFSVNARCASRLRYRPDFIYGNFGFRVASPSVTL